MDTAIRLLRLLELLPQRPLWRGDELAARLGFSARTVRNDVRRLRELDFEVTSSAGTEGGYRLRPGSHLPPVQFDDGEATAAAIGLRLATVSGLGVDADRAQAKLDRLLPGRLTRAARRISETTDVLANAFTPTDLDSLTSAIERHERLRFEYRAGDGEPIHGMSSRTELFRFRDVSIWSDSM